MYIGTSGDLGITLGDVLFSGCTLLVWFLLNSCFYDEPEEGSR